MKEKSRSLPISPMLKRVLPFINVEKIKTASTRVLTDRIKDVFENHHLHDLRHTFITRAQECGIRREIVSLWAGHKADSSITTTVYTHFQERSELQLQEIVKYDYEY
jgi:integrase